MTNSFAIKKPVAPAIDWRAGCAGGGSDFLDAARCTLVHTINAFRAVAYGVWARW